jgi:sarcosine oxidase subunit alpha
MRITDHPILKIDQTKEKVKFYFEEKELYGFKDEPIIAALIDNDIKAISYSHNKKRARGMFCANGKCSQCLMEVDGKKNVRVCITKLKQGMKIKIQK